MSDTLPEDSGALTQLLVDAQAGDSDAYAKVYEHLYAELKQHARFEIAARPASTLSATALVHEAFLKLTEPENLAISDRRHFLRISVRAMRQVLIDHFRSRQSDKRGGEWVKSPIDLDRLEDQGGSELIAEIDSVLARLGHSSPRVAEVVEYKFFLGLNEAEIAGVLQISERTVRNDWKKGRMWLAHALDDRQVD